MTTTNLPFLVLSRGFTESSEEDLCAFLGVPDKDGWIHWNGSTEWPIIMDPYVDIKFRDDFVVKAVRPELVRWNHRDDIGDVIAYRISKDRRSAVSNP